MNAPLPLAAAQADGLKATNYETAASAVAAQARATVSARYEMALRRPRNWDQVRVDIIRECRRPSFAHDKSALYRKPIGEGVEGLGIRFAEMALRCMTNVLIESAMIYESETKEIHRVTVTDLESNVTYPLDVPISKTVERSKPEDDGSYYKVRLNTWQKPVYTVAATDDDLLNKRGALQSKAIRTLALRVIPGDIQNEAEETIRAIRIDRAAKDPDGERRAIVDAFDDLNVSATSLEAYLGHPIGQCSPKQLVELRGLYAAIRDGEATWKQVMDNKAEQSGEAPPPADTPPSSPLPPRKTRPNVEPATITPAAATVSSSAPTPEAVATPPAPTAEPDADPIDGEAAHTTDDAPPPPPSSTSTGAPAVGVFPATPGEKQNLIVRARNAGIDMAGLLASVDAVDIDPTTLDGLTKIQFRNAKSRLPQ